MQVHYSTKPWRFGKQFTFCRFYNVMCVIGSLRKQWQTNERINAVSTMNIKQNLGLVAMSWWGYATDFKCISWSDYVTGTVILLILLLCCVVVGLSYILGHRYRSPWHHCQVVWWLDLHIYYVIYTRLMAVWLIHHIISSLPFILYKINISGGHWDWIQATALVC